MLHSKISCFTARYLADLSWCSCFQCMHHPLNCTCGTYSTQQPPCPNTNFLMTHMQHLSYGMHTTRRAWTLVWQSLPRWCEPQSGCLPPECGMTGIDHAAFLCYLIHTDKPEHIRANYTSVTIDNYAPNNSIACLKWHPTLLLTGF